MPQPLSLRDSRQAGECARILAAPFDYAGFAEWSREASESLRVLLGGDNVTLLITDGSRIHNRSVVSPQWAVREYVDRYLFRDKWQLLTHALEYGAFTRRMVWADNREEILNSAYWNELVRPTRSFDTIGMTATVTDSSDIANMQFYHDRETGPKFGLRGLAILRAVYPAFVAGSRSWIALHAYSRHLANLVDTMPVGVVLARIDGSTLHQNPSIRRMLATNQSGERLLTVISGCIDSFRRDWISPKPVGIPAAPRPKATDHQISGRAFRITTSFLGRGVLAGGGAIIVMIEPLGAPAFPAIILKDRYHLTQREVEVARLLVEGKTNPELAAALGVSAFTARHHTESVMLKLGVNTRGKIASLLAGLTAG